MQVTKGSHVYVCVFLRPGYFETGVLGDYFRAEFGNAAKPAYFWADNIESDDLANYRIRLNRLSDPTIEEDVYIPRDYVLLVTTQKAKGDWKPDTQKIGFRLSTEEVVPTAAA